jgi:hypothetical protein
MEISEKTGNNIYQYNNKSYQSNEGLEESDSGVHQESQTRGCLLYAAHFCSRNILDVRPFVCHTFYEFQVTDS